MNTTVDARHIAHTRATDLLKHEGVFDALSRSQAIIEFELDGRVVTANENFLQLMGYRLEEIVGLHHRMFCRESDVASPAYAAFWEALQAGTYASGEFLRLTKGGQVVYIQASYNPLLDDQGRPFRVIKFASDITRAKAKSLEDDGKLTAIDRSQGRIEFDLTGKVLDANENFLNLMGYELADIRGEHHRMFVDEKEHAGAAYRLFWQRLGRGDFESGDFLRIGKHGKRVCIQANYNPILDLDGKPVKVVKFCTDITAAKLLANETAVRRASVSTSNCIVEIDTARKILSLNPTMAASIGADAASLIGAPEAKVMFDEDVRGAQHESRWAQLLAGETVSCEMRYRHQEGTEVWLSGSISPVVGLVGEVTKVVLIAQDVTKAMMARLDASSKIAAIDRAQAVIEFDTQGKVLNANENFLTLMDYRLPDIQGRHHRMFVDAAYAATTEYGLFWDRLSRGEFEANEYKRIGRNGKECWIQATYNPVFDRNGKLLKVVKFAIDVTALKLRNAEFEAKVAAIEMGQAVIEFDLDGKVLTANRNFLAAMGYTLREVQGYHHSMFCTTEYAQGPEYRDFWLKLSEGEFISGRFQRVGKFGREVWIQATYTPILDINGKVSKVVKFAYDVTKAVQLERRIASNSDEMNASVRNLVASISDIAENSSTAAAMAEKASEVARVGHESLKKSIVAIGAIQSSSTRVGEIVRVIGDIANQTNLLAFNAAIEAARAGQHGVGFSVVASEVRKLAERSSQAAHEISKLIDDSVQHVSHGAEVSKEAASSFEAIMSSVARTGDSVNQIAKSTKTQSDMATTVSTLIETLTGERVS